MYSTHLPNAVSEKHDPKSESINRSAELIALYVNAINRIRKGINDANAEFATHTFVHINGNNASSTLASDTTGLLSGDVSDDEFQTRLALEKRSIDATLLETGALIKTLELLINEVLCGDCSRFQLRYTKSHR